jgi:hypothetical protein
MLIYQAKYVKFGDGFDDGMLREVMPALLQLPHIEQVDLDGTSVSDEGVILLKDMPNLNVLVVTRTAVTDLGLSKIRNSRPHIDIIQ